MKVLKKKEVVKVSKEIVEIEKNGLEPRLVS